MQAHSAHPELEGRFHYTQPISYASFKIDGGRFRRITGGAGYLPDTEPKIDYLS